METQKYSLYFRKHKPLKSCLGSKHPISKNKKNPLLKNFLYFRKWNFLGFTLRNFLIFQEVNLQGLKTRNFTFFVAVRDVFKYKGKREKFLILSLIEKQNFLNYNKAFFLILQYFFLYSTSLCFHLLRDFCNVTIKLSIFSFFFFRKILISFTKCFWILSLFCLLFYYFVILSLLSYKHVFQVLHSFIYMKKI